MYEARCQLFARAEVIAPNIGLDHLVHEKKITAEEAQLVRDKFTNFIMAMIDKSGVIKDVPEDLVQRLIDECSSSGDYDAIDREVFFARDEEIRELLNRVRANRMLVLFGKSL